MQVQRVGVKIGARMMQDVMNITNTIIYVLLLNEISVRKTCFPNIGIMNLKVLSE